MTAGGADLPPPSLPELRDRDNLRAAVLARRAGRPRQLKRLLPETEALLQDAIRAAHSGGAPLPSELVQAITAGLAAPTWNRYTAALRSWRDFASARCLDPIPADPTQFACYLAEQGRGERGYSQTKARMCAIRALSNLVGAPSPHEHPLVAGYRLGARRTKVARRGSVRPIFAHEIPRPGSSPLARGRGGRPLPARSRRARDAAARHMAFLHDGALRYDDMLEGQLGDILCFDSYLDLSVFGSKTDRRLAGQPATMPRSPEPTSGATGLFQTARFGMVRLLELPQGVLAAVAARFQAANDDPSPTGRDALATWPDDIRALADRLYTAGIAAHRLPVFGRWLFDDLTADSDLTAAPSTAEFARLARATLAGAGVDVTRAAAHSMRRGRVAGL